MNSRNEELVRLLTEYMSENKYKAYVIEVLENHFKFSTQIEVLPLSEAISDIKSGKLSDFIYDRPSELVLFNIESIHPTITAGLFFAHQIYERQPKDLLAINPHRARQKAVMQSSEHKYTVAYLNTYGVYRSSMSNGQTLQIGDDFTLNGQEKKIFSEYRKNRIGQNESSETIYSVILNQLIK